MIWFNDVIVDFVGWVFCGMMLLDMVGGWLFCFDIDGMVMMVEIGVGIFNGMGFICDCE